MIKKIDRNANRKRRHARVKNRVSGTGEKPRLSVYRSDTHIYAQLIDDMAGRTLTQASALNKILELDSTKSMDATKAVGTLIAERAKEKRIEEAVFDRSGYIYRGRIVALTEATREIGLKF